MREIFYLGIPLDPKKVFVFIHVQPGELMKIDELDSIRKEIDPRLLNDTPPSPMYMGEAADEEVDKIVLKMTVLFWNAYRNLPLSHFAYTFLFNLLPQSLSLKSESLQKVPLYSEAEIINMRNSVPRCTMRTLSFGGLPTVEARLRKMRGERGINLEAAFKEGFVVNGLPILSEDDIKHVLGDNRQIHGKENKTKTFYHPPLTFHFQSGWPCARPHAPCRST